MTSADARIEAAMQAIGGILKLLSPDDRRTVVQAMYNVELGTIGGMELLRPLGVIESAAKRRAS